MKFSPVNWFFLIALISAFIFFIRGLRVLRSEIIIKYFIPFTIVFSGLLFLDNFIHLKFLKLIALVLLLSAVIVLISDIFLYFFFSLKHYMRAKKDLSAGLPPHIMEICSACESMASTRTGALIIVEKKDPLEPFISSGMPYDADIRAEILLALFAKTSPVHDGAVIVMNGRISRVKSILPISTSALVPMGVGTRHRAAIGITEKTDALVFVVSEERGELSIAYKGNLFKPESQDILLKLVQDILRGKNIV
ncbi:MAG TPA: DNA integrity scanning protein DisA nucleotide-binding domain protein [Candidatus Omnitrophota bacterium]|nr:DNA integrity scanning protein DisA nucleotide-binding domain protein [Candidatus Omnitrophota bacterium]HPS19671.1 DNA integrity scanning protein DisA nucleotide-binding domain protein [Candidatus Omnitrophota bacterium]